MDFFFSLKPHKFLIKESLKTCDFLYSTQMVLRDHDHIKQIYHDLILASHYICVLYDVMFTILQSDILQNVKISAACPETESTNRKQI